MPSADFPVRIRIAVPDRGLGECLNDIQQWLDENAGADGWTTSPGSMPPLSGMGLPIGGSLRRLVER
jgi:hypothetical protein